MTAGIPVSLFKNGSGFYIGILIADKSFMFLVMFPIETHQICGCCLGCFGTQGLHVWIANETQLGHWKSGYEYPIQECMVISITCCYVYFHVSLSFQWIGIVYRPDPDSHLAKICWRSSSGLGRIWRHTLLVLYNYRSQINRSTIACWFEYNQLEDAGHHIKIYSVFWIMTIAIDQKARRLDIVQRFW